MSEVFKTSDNGEVRALFKVYYDAGNALRKKRDELIPLGSVVMSQIDYDASTEVLSRDVRPHQIMTASGVMCWENIEIKTKE